RAGAVGGGGGRAATRRGGGPSRAPFWRDRWLLVVVSALSAAFHLSQVGVQYLLARAAGTRLPVSYCLIMHPVLSLMTALPLSVGGVGGREGGYPYFLTPRGMHHAVA